MTFALPDTGEARYCVPKGWSSLRSSAEPSREIEEHSTRMRGAGPLPGCDFESIPDGPDTTSLTSFQVETMTKTMSQPASSTSVETIFAPSFASGSALARVRFQTWVSQPACARRCAISKPMRPVPIQPIFGCFAAFKSVLLSLQLGGPVARLENLLELAQERGR